MYDGGKIIFGLALFVGLITMATWMNLASGGHKTKLVVEPPPGGEKQCVKDKDWMRANHMKLLDQWRDWVVRDGKRPRIRVDGRLYELSLVKTCMKCHSNKAAFCDKCHLRMGVTSKSTDLDCWNCHVAPKGK